MAKNTKKEVNAEEEVKDTASEAAAEDMEEVKEEISEEEAAETEEAEETEETEDTDETAEESEEAEDGSEGKKDKKLFGKGKADKEKEAMKEQIEALEDKVKRQLAEFENFRTRTEREKSASFELGSKSVLEKILPVVDNFERGLASIPEDRETDAFSDGMNMIYKQLMTELDKLGVTPIEALGQPFDPNLHNAVMQEPGEEGVESGTVTKELQKGYMYHDMVLRHSMVAVAE